MRHRPFFLWLLTVVAWVAVACALAYLSTFLVNGTLDHTVGSMEQVR